MNKLHAQLASIFSLLTRFPFKKVLLSPIFLVGLFLRLIFMPFTVSPDFISMYWRAHVMAEWNIWHVPYNQYLGHTLYAFNLWFMKLLGFSMNEIFFVPFGDSIGSFSASTGDWLRFVEISNINQILFFLKLPHLAFDLAILGLLLYWFKSSKYFTRIFIFWWLNPITIYAFYVFGRHDAFTLFFILIAALAFAKKQIAPMLLGIFAAIQIRMQPLILSPLFIIPYFQNLKLIKSQVVKIAWAMLFIFCYWAIIQLLPSNNLLLAELRGLPVDQSTLSSSVGIPLLHIMGSLENAVIAISIFIAILISFCVSMLGVSWGKSRQSFILITAYIGLTLATYLIVNPILPHHFVWLAVSAAILSAVSKRIARWYTLAIFAWMSMGILGLAENSINQLLFLPVSTYLVGTPVVADLLQIQFSGLSANPALPYFIARGLFSFFLLGMSWEMIKIISPHFSGNTIKKILYTKLFIFICFFAFLNPQKAQASNVPILSVTSADAQVQLNHGQPLGQVFKAPNKEFGIIEVRFNTARSSAEDQIVFRLRKVGDGDWFYTETYSSADFNNGYFYAFGFPPIYEPGAYYRFEIELLKQPTEGQIPLAVYVAENRYKNGLMTFKGEPFTKYDINFRVKTEVPSSELSPYIIGELLTKISNQKVFFFFYSIGMGGILSLLLFQLVKHFRHLHKHTEHFH